ncbi:uncharacterized protein LOC144295508 isoform X1 [Canis aureus]
MPGCPTCLGHRDSKEIQQGLCRWQKAKTQVEENREGKNMPTRKKFLTPHKWDGTSPLQAQRCPALVSTAPGSGYCNRLLTYFLYHYIPHQGYAAAVAPSASDIASVESILALTSWKKTLGLQEPADFHAPQCLMLAKRLLWIQIPYLYKSPFCTPFFCTGEAATGSRVRTSLTTGLQRITEVVFALVPSAGHLISTLPRGRDPVSPKDTSGRVLWRVRWVPAVPSWRREAKGQIYEAQKIWDRITEPRKHSHKLRILSLVLEDRCHKNSGIGSSKYLSLH